MNKDIERIQKNIDKLNYNIARYERMIIACKKELLNQNKIIFMLTIKHSNHPVSISEVIKKANNKNISENKIL